jgi:uncharacterized membrane protein
MAAFAFVPAGHAPLPASSSFLPPLSQRRPRPALCPAAPARRRVVATLTGANGEPPTAEPPAQPSTDFRKVRKLLTFLSSLGVAETVYLSVAKLFTSPAAICRTSGCVEVLSGPYSSFVGIPLSVVGIFAYATFAFLSSYPLGAQDEEVIVSDDGATEFRSAQDVYDIRDAATRPLLLAMASVLLVFSSYFMFLLTMVIRDTCPYCIFSAVLSTALFVVTAFVGRAVRDTGPALKIGGSSAVVSAVAAAAIFVLSSPGGLLAKMPSEPQVPPAVTEQSDSRTIAIGRNLKKRGAKMYGAYWCSHCHDQKQRLGQRAFSNVTYIECDKGGVNTQAKLCREKRIPGYPTWEIDGELYPGELQIDDLEKLAAGLPLVPTEESAKAN